MKLGISDLAKSIWRGREPTDLQCACLPSRYRLGNQAVRSQSSQASGQRGDTDTSEGDCRMLASDPFTNISYILLS
jgi:hypothetical protein